jgi:hypothetical protein
MDSPLAISAGSTANAMKMLIRVRTYLVAMCETSTTIQHIAIA